MTTTHDYAAATARLAAAQADVERLTALLSAEQTAPRLATWEDGVAAARRRHPGRTRSAMAAAGTDTGDAQSADITSVAGARAEARRRGAARRRAAGGAA